ncbi:hypothetical protein CI102_8443 [Trichoderma harzianum]|nr:hypothetical protein CI102_8443 [Trichoderma harzianum]
MPLMLFSDVYAHTSSETSPPRPHYYMEVFSLTCCPIYFIIIYLKYLYLGMFFILVSQGNYSHRCLTCRRRTIRRFHARNVLR